MRPDALSSLRSSLERMTPFGLGNSARVLELGIPALDAVLPQRGLPLGSVTELQVQGSSGAATSFALCACRAAQRSAAARSPWCAFIDPTASLFAPGVARLGVDLDHLLVTRPDLEAVNRVALRIAEAQLVSVLVIDLTEVTGHSGSLLPRATRTPETAARAAGPRATGPRVTGPRVTTLDEHAWQRTVRRLALAIRTMPTSVLLLTRSEQFQSLPLPTSLRLEFARRSTECFELRVAKDRSGRISTARSIAYSAFEPHVHRKQFHPEQCSRSDVHAGEAYDLEASSRLAPVAMQRSVGMVS